MEGLVIGCGNPFRQDDGLGLRVVEALQAQAVEGLRLVHAHQLTPELSEDVGRASRVVFVDASLEGEPGRLDVRRIDPGARPGPNFTHHVAPEEVLELAAWLYGRRPEAWMITVAGADFGLGEGLTAAVEGSLPRVISALKGLL